jgi:hypothetical protein
MGVTPKRNKMGNIIQTNHLLHISSEEAAKVNRRTTYFSE